MTQPMTQTNQLPKNDEDSDMTTNQMTTNQMTTNQMTTTLKPPQTTQRTSRTFNVDHGSGAARLLKPHRMGNRLWKPMFAMGLMGVIAAVILAAVRTNLVADANPADQASIEQLRHFVTGTLFLGFTGILAAISFAIARILGAFRLGGSQVQADVGADVQTLQMPATAKAFIALMMMGMMAVAVGSLTNIAAGLSFSEAADLVSSKQWYIFSVGLRRIGVGLYLTGITLGLVTIINVIQFQTIRIRQLG